MKKWLCVVVCIFIHGFLFAQGTANYKVSKGDTWYSIARKFHISYAELRLANKKAGDKLSPGQKLIIPGSLKANDPFFQKNKIDDNKSDKSVSEERIHVVSRSETLFGIAKKYNVSVKDLKEWNHLKENAIKNGQVLTIKQPKTKSIAGSQPVTVASSPDDVPVRNAVDPIAPEKKTSTESKVQSTSPVNSPAGSKQIIFAKGRKEVNETGVASWIEDEGITSGKYYALHHAAPIGTIIKVINRMNERYVYVKVVGKLPPTGDNEGLLIKISKSGADKLGVIDARFQAQLIYGIPETTAGK